MWPRFTRDDLGVAIHFLGIVLLLTGASMFIPCVVGLIAGEIDPAFDYLLSAGITLTLGALCRLVRIHATTLTARQSILLTGLTWFIVCVVGAVPLYLSGGFTDVFDAFFDSISGFTTTGTSMINDVNHLPYAHNIWRLLTHVIGGQGIIAIALTAGIFARSSGAGSLYKAEGKSDTILPNIVATARFSAVITAAFVAVGTILCAATCLWNGMGFLRSLFHGFCVAAAAFGTGGFTPMSTNIVYYHSIALEIILMILMSAGALNFSLYLILWRGSSKEMFKNIEMKTLLIWSLLVIAILGASFARDPYFADLSMLVRRGLFTTIAGLSNAGFTTFYASQMSSAMSAGIMFALLLSMSLGGATGSTSGGIKALRLALIVKNIVSDIKRALSPDTSVVQVRYHHLTDLTLDSTTAMRAMIVFLLFIITYLLGGMVGVALGYNPLTAIFESVSVTSNAGISAGICSPGMPRLLEAVYMLQMWAGRLEFLTLLALLSATFMIFSRRKRTKG